MEGELHIEVISKDSITDEVKYTLEEYIKSSEDRLYVPDDLSKGVKINFTKDGNEPEFYWYEEKKMIY